MSKKSQPANFEIAFFVVLQLYAKSGIQVPFILLLNTYQSQLLIISCGGGSVGIPYAQDKLYFDLATDFFPQSLPYLCLVIQSRDNTLTVR